MKRMIFVSNRLPKKVRMNGKTVEYEDSAGGLATGLRSISGDSRIKWIGWPGLHRGRLSVKNREKVRQDLGKEGYVPIFLTKKEIDDFYRGFCNSTIWPLFHYFIQFARYDRDQWEVYRKINRRFADAVMEAYEPGDMIWVHDYHLMLVPSMIRNRIREASIGFFLHIPFPSFEVFRLFPWREQLLNGLLGSNLIGFHTYDYVTHFLNSVRRIEGHEHDMGVIPLRGHLCKVDAYPMGIDYRKFEQGVKDPGVKPYTDEISGKVGKRKIILSIDRLDYSKGILNRLESFDRFLREHPEWRERVTMILVAVPSRENVDRYEQLKRQIDEKIGGINGRYGRIGWAPVWYIYRFLPFEQLLALYKKADVFLVTPLRDGMNLMAKEFLAAREDSSGVLILSEMAGAAHELGEALIVNPNDYKEIADNIHMALNIPLEDQRKGNRLMQERLRRYDIGKWSKNFFGDLEKASDGERSLFSRKIGPAKKESIKKHFNNAKDRLVVLDYDGTLSDFTGKPEDAVPDGEVIGIMDRLSMIEGVDVVLISGRDRHTIDHWFKGLPLKAYAEHGIWYRNGEGKWKLVAPMDAGWKSSIRELLQIYTDRTPGSFVEEKEHSLVWHYRRADPEMGKIRSRELTGDLLDLISNTDLGILEGNKVIEIRKIGVNKGSSVSRLLGEKNWDLVMAIGDDVTDEDMFEAVPENGLSIKVGLGPTKAEYCMGSVDEVRSFLKEIAEK